MSFVEQLTELLPSDLPHRDHVIQQAAEHLRLIVEANQRFNLTRIVDEREAAIKHVLDSVLPWQAFWGAPEIFDIGTGAGFPGIPLALALPDIRFTLIESIGKKARFVQSAVEELDLPNVAVMPRRAEEVLRGRTNLVFTARAVAPIAKALDLFGPAIRAGCRALLYKGPDAEAEIASAAAELKKRAIRARIAQQYSLPEGMGTRLLVELQSARA